MPEEQRLYRIRVVRTFLLAGVPLNKLHIFKELLDYSSLKFWKDHELSIPKWSDAARNIFLLQPSSAAAERLFSVLNNSFGKKQLGSLEDYIETSVMLQFNKRGM